MLLPRYAKCDDFFLAVLLGLFCCVLPSPRLAAADSPTSQPSTAPSENIPVSGTVTLADGVTPVAQAIVMVAEFVGKSDLGRNGLGVTDKAGNFSLRLPIPSGAYTVRVVTKEGQFIVWEPLTIANESGPLVLRLHGASGSMEGKVTDDAGAPAGNAPITIVDMAQKLVYKTKTDDEGGYEIEGILPGRYMAIVQSLPKAGKLLGDQACVEKDIVVDKQPVEKDFSLQARPLKRNPAAP